MPNKPGELIQWLQEIGDDLAVSANENNLLESPVETLKKKKAVKKTSPSPQSQKSQEVETKKLVSQAQSLDELKTLMAQYEGCDLKKMAKNMVFGDGNPEAKIMLIGEAPGAEEDIQGLPFVGASGQLLDQMFSYIGLDRSKYFITNIIPWRPPGNRNPTPKEIELCLPFVERRIELIKPKVIVLVGGISAKSLLNTNTGIMRLRGKWHDYTTANMEESIQAYPIFHPSYLLRSPGQKRLAWQDLLTIKKKLQAENLL